MPRILMTADAVGGVWTFALDLARALAVNGTTVILAVMGPSPSVDQRRAAASVAHLRLEAMPFRLEWMRDAWDDLARAGEWLLDVEDRFHPDLVHLNGYVHAALPFRTPVVVTAHSCVCSWNDAVGGRFDLTWLDRYKAAVARGLASADAVVAPSHAMLSALRRHYGPLPDASVIWNGRDPRAFRSSTKEPLVFAAGRVWDPAKNIGAVVRIAPTLPWPVAVAGDGGEPAPNVRYLGRLPASAIAGWLGRASIVTLPARYEPFGLMALEAALCGCALVLGDIPSQREIWGDAATFIDPESDASLSDAIRSLVANPAAIAHAGARARARALEYTADRMAAGYQSVYGAARRRRQSAGSLPCAS